MDRYPELNFACSQAQQVRDSQHQDFGNYQLRIKFHRLVKETE
jgi:hypothetical protein